MMIMLNGSAYPTPGKNLNIPEINLNIDSALAPYLENSKRQYRMATQMLQEVVVKSTAIKRVSHNDYPALTGLSAQPDYFIDSNRFKDCPLLLSCLQSAAMGLTYADNTFYVTRVYNSGLRVPVQVFYNGMPVETYYINNIVSASSITTH